MILNGKNDLEKSAFKLYPNLKKIKNILDQNKQANFVRMTGSGSAIIMYFNSNKFAKNALKIYKRKLNNCCIIVFKDERSYNTIEGYGFCGNISFLL